jgi:hypothetical protein
LNTKRIFASGLLVAASLVLPLPAFSAPQLQKAAPRQTTPSNQLQTVVEMVGEKGAALRSGSKGL